MHLPLFVGVLCWSLFWCALLYVFSRFATILTRKRELVALLLLFFGCLVTVYVLWLFLMVPRVGLQFVMVVFPDHTHLLFYILSSMLIHLGFFKVPFNFPQSILSRGMRVPTMWYVRQSAHTRSLTRAMLVA